MTRHECECDQPVALPHDTSTRCATPSLAHPDSNHRGALAVATAGFLLGLLLKFLIVYLCTLHAFNP